MASPVVQFGRAAKLVLFNEQNAIVLSNGGSSDLRFRFRIEATDLSVPNKAYIRVYNVAPATIQRSLQEFQYVGIDAGYGSNVANIFNGTITQYRTGKESNVDSYLDIFAADGDEFHNFVTLFISLQTGATALDLLKEIVTAANEYTPLSPVNFIGDPQSLQALKSVQYPRGKVSAGLARDALDDLAATCNFRWSIQNGNLTVISNSAYLPGEAVEINSLTGMVGVPEATDQGITVRTLLNPAIKIGHLVLLNNNDIAQSTVIDNFYPGVDPIYVAGVNPNPDPRNNGTYRTLLVEHEGDTRGEEWFTDIICVTVNLNAIGGIAGGSVAPYGGAQ